MTSADVETYLAVIQEIRAAPNRGEALGPVLDRRGIGRSRWEDISARVVAAAIAWIPSRDMPVPETWEDDLRVVGPYRDRIRAVLDD
jgi:hypothetical protein